MTDPLLLDADSESALCDDPESDLCDPVEPSSSNFLQMRLKDLKIDSVCPVTVTILSGTDPSDM